MTPFTAARDGVRVKVRAVPRASRDRIEGIEPDGRGGARLRVAVTAPPVEGAANTAIVRLLASAWDLPRSVVEVVSGAGARDKTVLVAGDPDDLLPRLEAWAGQSRKGR